jgi:hypothetical protein
MLHNGNAGKLGVLIPTSHVHSAIKNNRAALTPKIAPSPKESKSANQQRCKMWDQRLVRPQWSNTKTCNNMTVHQTHPMLSTGHCPNTGDNDIGMRVQSATHGQDMCSLNNTENSLPGTWFDLAQPTLKQMLEPEAPPCTSGSVLTGEGALDPSARGKIGTAHTRDVNEG